MAREKKSLISEASEAQERARRAKESALAEMSRQEAEAHLNRKTEALLAFMTSWGKASYNRKYSKRTGLTTDKKTITACYRTMLNTYSKYPDPAMRVLIKDLENQFPYLRER